MYRFILLSALATIGGLLGTLALTPPQRPADFRVANSEECRTLDPHLMQWTQEIRIGFALYEGLTTPDPQTTEPRPGVAERWDISPDGLTYTFHLRPDARWSTGTPVTTRDFVDSWQRSLNPRLGANNSGALFVIAGGRAHYESIAAHDADGATPIIPFAQVGVRDPTPRTLVVTLEHPCPYFLDLVGAMPIFWPVYRPALEDVAYVWPDGRSAEAEAAHNAGREILATRHLWTRPDRFVGNGPYVLESWDFERKLRLRRNPHYWNAENVALETIDVYPVADRNTRFMRYETGAVDLALDPSAAISRVLYRQMLRGQRRDYQHGRNLATYFYRLNTNRPPLDDPRVRRALAQAIDRETLCTEVWGFGQEPARTLVPPIDAARRAPEYGRPAGLGFDVRAARESLGRAGWVYSAENAAPVRRGGTFPALEILYNTDALHDAVAQAVAHAWRTHLGIRVELRNVDAKVLTERVRNRDYDIARGSWYADYLDPATFLEVFHSAGGNNQTGFADPRYDELLEQARREPDPPRRLALLADAERLLVEEQLPVIPLNYYVGAQLLHPDFTGVTANSRQFILFKYVRCRGSEPSS